MTIIKDGSGAGNEAKVDTTNRLRTRTVSDTSIEEAFKEGRAFLFSSGTQTLTTSCESYIMYIQNCDTRDMFAWILITCFGQSVNICGCVLTGDYLSAFILCPTGCITTCGTIGVIPNLNLGSGLTACAVGRRGGEGTTACGFANTGFFSGPGRLEVENLLVIPKGKSLALSITPPAGNVSMRGQVTIKFYFVEDT